MGGLIVARMLVRMISSMCNFIKRYCYVVDCPSRTFVMMMMMMNILVVENHMTLLCIDVSPPMTRSDPQEYSKVVVNIHQ